MTHFLFGQNISHSKPKITYNKIGGAIGYIRTCIPLESFYIGSKGVHKGIHFPGVSNKSS